MAHHKVHKSQAADDLEAVDIGCRVLPFLLLRTGAWVGSQAKFNIKRPIVSSHRRDCLTSNADFVLTWPGYLCVEARFMCTICVLRHALCVYFQHKAQASVWPLLSITLDGVVVRLIYCEVISDRVH